MTEINYWLMKHVPVVGGTYNTQNKPQRKTPTHTHQKSMYMRDQLKLRK